VAIRQEKYSDSEEELWLITPTPPSGTLGVGSFDQFKSHRGRPLYRRSMLWAHAMIAWGRPITWPSLICATWLLTASPVRNSPGFPRAFIDASLRASASLASRQACKSSLGALRTLDYGTAAAGVCPGTRGWLRTRE
jgi:hypothetical protein